MSRCSAQQLSLRGDPSGMLHCHAIYAAARGRSRMAIAGGMLQCTRRRLLGNEAYVRDGGKYAATNTPARAACFFHAGTLTQISVGAVAAAQSRHMSCMRRLSPECSRRSAVACVVLSTSPQGVTIGALGCGGGRGALDRELILVVTSNRNCTCSRSAGSVVQLDFDGRMLCIAASLNRKQRIMHQVSPCQTAMRTQHEGGSRRN